ncbi:tryptophan synthase, alpha subunit [Syntrophotalea carbinolica DSM 2380]|uniref:Tryptophan synthase alpha chain n=1 Tax=Syntrophotalea carbinolica (strain DSM 2380 / NBRC 103641 / GraBd1) TaxID=338963 RepID=TRPA_SYNC1|nr:tryptophan synthase subunit alpha [Syntrophotalea carbinolica]Q3A2C7.1 RecName: Full=Tryptophan synthase alpha chain [Syntrophotalea carbinolica DSM 2380]ABA89480.1 tryptophan synthase, alpha subunit [Syntrophotalea carbinolica DSM 2380]
MLETTIRNKLAQKDILLMTHIVIGYPDLDTSFEVVRTMVEAGVDLMELQIPFSEPMADGPVILKANQDALATGITVDECFDFAEKVAAAYDIPFLFMTYYNILFKYGVEAFAERMAKCGLCGAIVPDLPPEEADDYLAAMNKHGMAPIFIYAPNTTEARMQRIAEHGKGFIYCMARKGVTGLQTDFSGQLGDHLDHCRASTQLPLALGFGVKDRADVEFIKGKADIAVVGSQAIRVLDEGGVPAVEAFIRSLR